MRENEMDTKTKIAILGTGNIGKSIASGLLASGSISPENVTLTRRKINLLESFKNQHVQITDDNIQAVKQSNVIIIAVEPQQINTLLNEISDSIDYRKHIIISVVTGVTIEQIQNKLGADVALVRAMPNTAISLKESMTCLASTTSNSDAVEMAKAIFDTLGKTLLIEEEMMSSATALGACGVAFFLRAIRAASQGGIEIGFHADKAMLIAAQTAKGAASLLLQNKEHPEYEIDKVTTPRGVTISGLNQMEHEGFSSAMIRGIVVAAEKAEKIYKSD
jgi:pyrroline-5-carboxylate reductase